MSKRTISDYSTLTDGWTLYRALLASQPDELSSLSGVELVRKKVKSLYIMAGVFTFTPSAIGHHRYQKPGSNAWCDAMLQKIRSYNAVK